MKRRRHDGALSHGGSAFHRDAQCRPRQIAGGGFGATRRRRDDRAAARRRDPARARRGPWPRDLAGVRRRGNPHHHPRHGRARHGRFRRGRAADARFRRQAVERGRRDRLLRPHDLAAGEDPAGRSGRADHGGDPRSGRAQHVAEARQYRRRRARQLPQERIPADDRGDPLARSAQNTPPTCCATCRTISRSRSSRACCAWNRCRRKRSTISRTRCAPSSSRR